MPTITAHSRPDGSVIVEVVPDPDRPGSSGIPHPETGEQPWCFLVTEYQRDALARVLAGQPYLTDVELGLLFDGKPVDGGGVAERDGRPQLIRWLRERLADRPALPAPTSSDILRSPEPSGPDGALLVQRVAATWDVLEGADASAAAGALQVAGRAAERNRRTVAERVAREREEAQRNRRQVVGRAAYTAWGGTVEWETLPRATQDMWCRVGEGAAAASAETERQRP